MSLYLKEMRIAGLNTLITRKENETSFRITFDNLTNCFLFEDYEEADKFLEWYGIDTEALCEDDKFDRLCTLTMSPYGGDVKKPEVFKKANRRFIEIKRKNFQRKDVIK